MKTLDRLKNMFKKKKVNQFDTIHSRFSKIIMKWIKERNKRNDHFWYKPSQEDSFFPRYVMEMMHEINKEMPKPMLNKIKAKETFAMGHVDYVHKFALYCTELYLNEIENQSK